MATLTPQQQSLLNQIAQQAQQIQSQLGTLAAAQKAGMTITPQTSVQQAASYISSRQPSTSSGGASQTMSALTSGGNKGGSYINSQTQQPVSYKEGSTYDDTSAGLRYRYTNGQWQPIASIPKTTTSTKGQSISSGYSGGGTQNTNSSGGGGGTQNTNSSSNSPSSGSQQYYWVPSLGVWLNEYGVQKSGAKDAIPVSGFGVMPNQTQNNQNNQNNQNPLNNQPPDWQTAYKQLLDQYQSLLQKYSNPPTPDTSNISNIYSKAASDLTAKYQKVLADLQKKQQEDQQRLVGRYAAAGFSEPGILGGSPAGIPGVATKGLNELESQQASDITNLQQAQAGDMDALAAAQASAVQQAQQQAIDNYYKQLQLMQSVLGNQANLLTYQTPAQQLAQELQKEELFKALGLGSYAKYEQPKVETIKEKDGSVWEIVRDDQGNIISKSEVIPPQSDDTTEKHTWELVLDPTTNKPLYFFDKSTGKLVPYQPPSSSTSSTDSQPGLWDTIKNFFTDY